MKKKFGGWITCSYNAAIESTPMYLKCLLAIMFGLSAIRVSAQTNCTVDVPAGLSTRGGNLIRDVSATAFAPGTKDVRVQSMAFDQGPRRIIFVVQRGPKMKATEYALATAILERILEGGTRTEDRFGLVTVGPGGSSVPLGTSPDSILTQARTLFGQKASGKSTGVLDGVQQALDSFGEPQTGDAVYVFAGEDRFDDDHAKFDKVMAELWRRKTRVFGFLFGYVVAGEYSGMWTGAQNGFSWTFLSYQDNLYYLAFGSDGSLQIENTKGSLQTYQLNPQRTAQVAQFGYQMYGSIIDLYRLTVMRRPSPKASDWKLDVSDDLRKQHRDAIVLYPRRLPGCS